MVVYAQVPGPYNETGRSYGSLFEYMRGLGWERAGPLREIYLINPAEVAPDELLAEIQLPCRVR
jgi:effector-binding domain-containing protein